jgi:hypothetical protein
VSRGVGNACFRKRSLPIFEMPSDPYSVATFEVWGAFFAEDGDAFTMVV